MKNYFLLLIGLCFTTWCQAQYENVWVFGAHAGVDFNGTVPVAIQSNISGYGEANASVCNASGQLLFYTEGTYIWDRNGNLMPNGSDLTLQASINLTSPTTSTTQGALIVPKPGASQQYYVFSLISFEQGMNAGKLYYSVVDMSLNGGMGDVVPGQKGILVDNGLTERMVSVLGNSCNIWLIVGSMQQLAFKAFEITASGVSVSPVVSVMGPGSTISGGMGALAVSPNREKIAATWLGGSKGATLYDFDPATGIVSNPLSLLPLWSSGYGVCFSPDNSKLYIDDHTFGVLRQFDLSSNNASAILASNTVLGVCGTTQIKSAPNGKLYFQSTGTMLGVISSPDLAGAACGFSANELQLLPNTSFYLGLPNAVTPLVSDTISTVQSKTAACFASHIVLKAADDTTGWGYAWSDGSTGPALNVNAPGLYRVRYHVPPCNVRTDSFKVLFPGGMLPQIITNAACNGNDNGSAFVQGFPGDTVSYSYTWLNAGGDTLSLNDTLEQAPPGSYYLHIQTASCDTTLLILVPAEQHTVAFSVDSVICQGDELTTQNRSDSYFSNFDWDFGDGNFSTQRDPAHVYQSSGVFSLRLTGYTGACADTMTQMIIVDSVSGVRFTADKPEICLGQSVFIRPVADTTINRLVWDFGDGNSWTEDNAKPLQHAYDSAGTFILKLKARFRACPDTGFEEQVTVYPLPKVDLGADTTLCLNGDPVYLKNLVTQDSGLYYSVWNTGDTSGTLKVVRPGLYSLSLFSRPLGCMTKETVKIAKGCYIDIPNAFTPNGDGVNDYFFPRQLLSKDLSAFQMQIFNRWGQMIFETASLDGRGWDGRFNGVEQPQGAYLYIITAEISGHSEHYRGNVTLLK